MEVQPGSREKERFESLRRGGIKSEEGSLFRVVGLLAVRFLIQVQREKWENIEKREFERTKRSEDWEFRQKLSCHGVSGQQIFLNTASSFQVPIFLSSSMYLWKSSLWSTDFIVLIFFLFRLVYFRVYDCISFIHSWSVLALVLLEFEIEFSVGSVFYILNFSGIRSYYFLIFSYILIWIRPLGSFGGVLSVHFMICCLGTLRDPFLSAVSVLLW